MATVVNSTTAWLKQHGAAERSFARALRTYFAEQAGRIADAWENFPSSPENLASVFQPDAEAAILWPLIRRNLSGLMVLGARAELEAVGERMAKAAEFGDDGSMDLPQGTVDALRAALGELEQQEFWHDIQSETAKNLRQIIEQGIADHLGNYSIGMLIREQLGGMAANKRSQRIARTEVTSAMNAGHTAAMTGLADAWLIVGKQWLAIGDRDARQTHADASGQTVPVRGMFRIGGYDAPYPGHWSLPARERIHCRCTLLSVLDASLTAD